MKNPFFNEDHESIRELARDYANNTLAPIASEIDHTDLLPPEIAKQMADLGFYGIKIPEAYGGLGLDMRSYICVIEEIAKKCATAILNISSANSLATAPLVLAGSEEQKKKYLPGAVAGDYYIAFALTEPNAGSDAAALSTKAVKDGNDYVLNGRKCFITHAPWAKYTTVYAKTSPEKGVKGISAFIVDMSLPGVSLGKPEEKMGQLGVPVSDIVLEDVRVPADCMIGKQDMGFINAMKTLSVGRIGVAAMAVGMAQEAVDLAVNHAKSRTTFGKPLAKHQAIAFMLADMETELNAARQLVYNAAWMADNGQDVTKEASMAKYFATEHAQSIINRSLQIHGGYGYTKEYAIERLYRDIRVTPIYEGSSQVQQMVISSNLLR